MEKGDENISKEVVQVGLQIRNSGVTQEHRVGSDNFLANQRSQKSEALTQSKSTQLDITQEKELVQNTQEQNTLQRSKANETFSQERMEFEEDKELEQKANVGISVQPKDERPSETLIQEHKEFTKDEELGQKAVVDIMVRQEGKSDDSSFVKTQEFIQTAQIDAGHQEHCVLKEMFDAGQKICRISVLGQDSMQITRTKDKDVLYKKCDAFELDQFEPDGVSAELKVVKTLVGNLQVQESIQQEVTDAIHPEFDAIVDDLIKPKSEINFTREREETIPVEHLNQKAEQESKEAVQQTNDLNSGNDPLLQAVASDPETSTHQDAKPIPFKPGTTLSIILRPPPPELLDPASRMYQHLYGTQKQTTLSSSRTRSDQSPIVQFQNHPPPEPVHDPRPEMGEVDPDVQFAEWLAFLKRTRAYQVKPRKRDWKTKCLELLFGLSAGGILVAILYWLVVFLETKHDTGGSNVTSPLPNLNDNWNSPLVTLQTDHLLAGLDFKNSTPETDFNHNNNTKRKILDVNITNPKGVKMTTLAGNWKYNVTTPRIDKDITINSQRINLDVNITSPLLDSVRKSTTPRIDLQTNLAIPTIDFNDTITATIGLDNITTPTIRLDGITTPTIRLDGITTPTIRLDGITTPTIDLDDLTTPAIDLDDLTTPTIDLDDLTPPTIDLDVKVNTSFVGLYSSVEPSKTVLNADLMDAYVSSSTPMNVFKVNITTMNIDLTVNITVPIKASNGIVSTPMGDEDINSSSTFAKFNVSVVNPVINLDCNETKLSDLNNSIATYSTKLDNKFFKWILYEKNHAFKNTIFKIK